MKSINMFAVFLFSIIFSQVTIADEPLRHTFDKRAVTIVWIKTTQANVANHCAAVSGKSSWFEGNVQGCAFYNPVSDTCTVYVSEPTGYKDDNGFKLLGHEFLHCFIGDFHN